MTKHIIIILILVLGARLAAADDTRLVAVVSAKAPITNISGAALKRAFLGDPVTVADIRLTPFNHAANTPERVTFDRLVLGMTPDEAGRYWIDRKVRGQGAAPRSLPAHHVAKVVAKFPGAISYIPLAELTPDVKPLEIDGIRHDDPRYALGRK